jgi:hypothetical protein
MTMSCCTKTLCRLPGHDREADQCWRASAGCPAGTLATVGGAMPSFPACENLVEACAIAGGVSSAAASMWGLSAGERLESGSCTVRS